MLYFIRGNGWQGPAPQQMEADLTSFDLWQVEVTPIVDFNGDSGVDILDVFELLEHWETTDNSLYDIAPLPFGDGIVDAKDLGVLADHMIESEMASAANGL